MNGTPQQIKDVLYVNGTGVYINDMHFEPHINNNYPAEQKFTDLAALYQSNAEKQIVYNGGSIENNVYSIPVREIEPSTGIVISNADFESGLDNLFISVQNGAQAGRDANVAAHNGDAAGRVLLPKQDAEARLYFKLQNLVEGKQYRISAYLLAKGNNQARLFIQQGSEYKYTSSYGNDTNWFYRFLDFTATGEEVEIGLHGVNLAGGNTNLYIDDVTVEEFPSKLYASYEAEDLVPGSKEQYLIVKQGENIHGITVAVPEAGEYMLRINYANKGLDIVSGMLTTVSPGGKIPFSRTGSHYDFSGNTVEMPVKLMAGNNTFSIENFSGELAIDRLEIVSVKSAGADIFTGINAIRMPNQITIYPAVATDLVYIKAPNNFRAQLNVLNSTGIRFYSSTWKGSGSFNISSFPEGLLLFCFNNTEYSFMYKIIKKQF
jgi:hypothetical protein